MTRLLAASLLAVATSAAFVTLSARDLQQGTLSREEIALAADRIRADRWYDDVTRAGAGQAARQSRSADMELLLLALRQPIPELRVAVLRELGRFELATNAPLIASFLNDPVGLVKHAAADALVQTLWDKSAADAAPSVALLDRQLLQERTIGGTASLWKAIAELPLDVETARKYETRFVNEIRQVTPLKFAALAALLTLTEHRRGRPLMADTEARVMDWARRGLSAGDPMVMIGTDALGQTIQFVEILQAAQADADDIAAAAAGFMCRKVVLGGCGFDIRRLGVDLLNPVNPAHLPALLAAARDRGDLGAASAAIRKLIQSPGVTRCQLLDIARQTPAESDVIAALAEDPVERKGECGDWTPEAWLTEQGSSLRSATRGTDWVAPAAALEALAKRAPDAARSIATEIAAVHGSWQVRVTAARVAGRLKDASLAVSLASDEHANVRAAALDALRAAESSDLWPAAIEALSSPDDHLVRTAALVLKGVPPSVAALDPLLEALRRLTGESRDTSRRARLAILERIGELTPSDPSGSSASLLALTSHLLDFDPLVARAAAALLQPSSMSPVEPRPKHRPAHQPTAEQIRLLPPCVLVSLEGEAVVIVALNRNVAPVAVATFLQAALSGYYDNSVIHRDDENLTVFGNRSANDEGGWVRFARDEAGTPVTAMSLMQMNHGPDTADGRLAVRWRGNPELGRRETVLGRVLIPKPSGGAEAALQLGKRIEKIVIGGEARLSRPGPADPCYPQRPW